MVTVQLHLNPVLPDSQDCIPGPQVPSCVYPFLQQFLYGTHEQFIIHISVIISIKLSLTNTILCNSFLPARQLLSQLYQTEVSSDQ